MNMHLGRYFKSFLWLLYIAVMLIVMNDLALPYQWDAIRQSFAQGYVSSDAVQIWMMLAYYCCAVLAIFACIKISYEYGLLLLFGFWAALVTEQLFVRITGHVPSAADIASLQDDWHRDDHYWSTYTADISYAMLGATAFIAPLIIFVWRRRAYNQRHFMWFFTPFALMCGLYYGLFFTQGEQSLQRFPKGFKVLLTTIVAEVNVWYQPPFQLRLGDYPEGQSVAPKIVLIVDQGVTYREFAKLQMGKTPYVFDYGRAWSAGNCSAASDAVLRRGGWDRELEPMPAAVHEVTSLFELGKQAGYMTAYIDNRNVLGSSITRHYFDEAEISFIDRYWDSTDPVDVRDQYSIKHIAEELKRDKVFILVNKIGAQRPFEDNIPASARSGNQKHNYQQTLERQVKAYLTQLIDVIDEQTVVFYTADHGQQFDKKRTYCNDMKNVTEDEFAVPFLVISKNVPFLQSLLPKKIKQEHQFTHLEIAETVRNTMGIQVQEAGSLFKSPAMLNRPYCGIVGSLRPMLSQPLQCYPLVQGVP